MSDYLKDIIKNSGNKYASVVEDGLEGSDVDGFLDTGSYILNALLSGSIHGGIANNKILALAGESSTGKTYFSVGIVCKFLKDNKDAVVLYFDTEQAVTSDMFVKRGVDPARVAVFPVSTVEEFRRQLISIIDRYLEQPEAERKPIMVVLDSLGMLSTEKEVADTAEGKSTRDMTRAQVVKSTFRVLTLKLGQAKIPLIMTNHTYDVIGSYVPTKEMGGGTGLKYAASTIVYLSKKKDKNSDGDVVGNIIHCKLYKGRLTKENKMVDVRLNYDTGLDLYYGLTDLALEIGLFKKNSTKIELPNGERVFEKQINDNPEKYFTPEILKQLDEAAGKAFKYGGTGE
jgi:RecA/RadA recombinase